MSCSDKGGHRDQEVGPAEHQQGRGSIQALGHLEQRPGGGERTADGVIHLTGGSLLQKNIS